MTGLLDDEEVLAVARLRTVGAGDSVFSTGDPIDAVHVLRCGVVMVRSITLEGEPAVVDVRGRGDLLDDTALLADAPSLQLDEARALTDCDLLQLPLTTMESLRDRSPEVGSAIVGQLSQQARRLSGVLVDLLGRPARARAARRLDALAEALARSGLDGEPLVITQRDLAEYVGTTRSTLNGQLTRLQDSGAVVVGRGRIRITDREALQRWF